jgi:hypothetical protein
MSWQNFLAPKFRDHLGWLPGRQPLNFRGQTQDRVASREPTTQTLELKPPHMDAILGIKRLNFKGHSTSYECPKP